MSDEKDISVEPTILTWDYDAPQERVFEAWTQIEQLQQWMAPAAGFACEYTSADIRPGGSSLHRMTAPNGFEMWLLTKYEEVTPPQGLVFRQYNSNKAGDVLPNPQMPDWPRELRTTIKLEQAGDKTHLKLVWQPMHATREEADAFENSRGEHGRGWSGGLEMLETHLASLNR